MANEGYHEAGLELSPKRGTARRSVSLMEELELGTGKPERRRLQGPGVAQDPRPQPR